ncbi:cache domain-containing protein [Malaciobacter mytili]|uniref:cache domain-containing protein n=1 Tax=Malaciobacter mytili TaxID=603050 RepID=UPI003BB07378
MKHNKIYILLLTIFFLLYIFIIYFTYTENKKYLLENTKNNQLKLVYAYKEKFDERLAALKRIVETLGKSLIDKDRNKEFKNIKETLTNAMISGNGFTSVYISYPDNFTISGRPDWYYTKDYVATKRPWYIEALKANKTIISKPYIGSAGFEDKLYISIVSPIYKQNKLVAVMASDLELESVQKELTKLFPLKNGFAFLMTNNAQVIAQSNKLGIDFSNKNLKEFLSSFSKNKVGYSTYKIANKHYIFTYETLEKSDWLFVSVLDEKEIYKDLNYQLFMNLLASVFLFLLGFATIIFISFIQKKLYEKHLLLGHFVKSPTWGILLTDKNGNIIFINKVFEKLFSLKSKALYNKSINNILLKLKINQKNNNQILCFKDIEDNIYSMKSYPLEHKGKYYRIQITPLVNNYQKKLEGTIITVNDISHEKYLEKKESEHEQILIQNSKMAALGEMVSAIAHQWRQPLSTLLMLLSNVEEFISKENPKAINYLCRSKDTIKYMNETVNAFRNFYKEDFEKSNFNLIDIINEVILISSPQMKMNALELEFKYNEKHKYTLESYPSYIKQVLINLISNAKDELSIILKDVPLYEGKIKIFLSKEENNFLISIEDNGRGILAEHKEKIFKPFFTTKKDQGTGTGLYLCKLLIENKINGKLFLDNLKNPTKFIIQIGTTDV